MRNVPCLLLLLALAARAEESADMTLQAKVSRLGGGFRVRFEGTAACPAGTVLRLTLYRLEEQPGAGLSLAESPLLERAVRAAVSGRRFGVETEVQAPCRVRAVVRIPEDEQTPEVRAGLGDWAGRRWSFEFPAWNGDLIRQLADRLSDVEGLAKRVEDLAQRLAGASPVKGRSELASLERDSAALRKALDRSEARRIYPAAVKDLDDVVRNLTGHAARAAFTAGGKTGAPLTYPALTGARTRHDREFTPDNLLKDVEEAVSLAGREFALWLVKELRRAGDPMAVMETLKPHAGRAGVSEFAERIQGAAPQDLESLEVEIRKGRAKP